MAFNRTPAPRSRLRPLRVHLLFLILGAMLPGALLTTILVLRSISRNRDMIERRLVDSARVDVAALDRELEATIITLESLASSPSLDLDDLDSFYAEARRVHLAHPGWYSILLLTPDGQQLVSTRLPWGTPLLAVHEPDSLHLLLERRAPVVGLLREPPRGGSELLFPVRIPVIRFGEIKYALTAILDTAALSRLIRSELPASDEWTRALLDPAGTIAVRTRDPSRFVGRVAKPEIRARLGSPSEEAFRAVGLDGTEVYAVLSSGAFGWTAAVTVPLSTLDAPLRRSTVALLLGGVLLMLSGLGAVLLISRRLTRDLDLVARSAEALVGGAPVPDAEPYVAETKQLQESLRAASALLEDRLRERDQQVLRAEAACAEAEQANRTKDHFLAVLGHELRNPLAPSLTVLEILKRRSPDVIPRERALLERQIGHMVRLVNDLLDVSGLARGKVDLVCQRFELRRAVDRAIDMARPLLDQQAHDLSVRVPEAGCSLHADEDRIVQVLTNLLTNAARYTPPGGHVSLLAREEDGQVILSCEDDGPGIAPDLVPVLFDPFVQGPRTIDRRVGGLGLGLSLARSFTELHGGTLRYESRSPERGSRFLVRLPLAGGPAGPLFQ